MLKEIIYLGHSAWCVKTEEYTLIFDYGVDEKRQEEGNLYNGVIHLEALKNEDVIIFASHSHGDHYNKNINRLAAGYENVTHVLGNIKSSYKNTIQMIPHEEKVVKGVKIITTGSTDLGVAFLVQADDVVIFHSGDHANWEDNDTEFSFEGEIDFISNYNLKIDVAFIPVCTFRGLRPEKMTNGARYTIEKLNPNLVFPMHANGREFLYKEFEADMKKAGVKNRIICAETVGLMNI